MSELKPCPFCGGEADIERAGNHRVSTLYHCLDCGLSLETGETFNHGGAWNTRAGGWISVDSDNEPLNYQVVLISTTDADGDQVTVTATYNGDGKYLVTGGYRDKDLTHWMPLPKPPEG